MGGGLHGGMQCNQTGNATTSEEKFLARCFIVRLAAHVS